MKEEDKKLLRIIGALSTVGITLVAATMIGFFAGRFLDRLFSTSPWLTIIFLILGIIAGFKNLFDHARKYQNITDKRENK